MWGSGAAVLNPVVGSPQMAGFPMSMARPVMQQNISPVLLPGLQVCV